MFRILSYILPLQDTLVIGRAGKVLRLVRVMRILRVFKVMISNPFSKYSNLTKYCQNSTPTSKILYKI